MVQMKEYSITTLQFDKVQYRKLQNAYFGERSYNHLFLKLNNFSNTVLPYFQISYKKLHGADFILR